ncbi:MAG: response regulator transcription factor [Desulfatibacillaceae bacterium]|nr:response regulator transcription factor [Desulfatibacillaceae bacterium]
MTAANEPRDKGADAKLQPAQVQIVGPNKLQNELLAYFLFHAENLSCICTASIEPSAQDKNSPAPMLVMLDCLNCQGIPLWATDPQIAGPANSAPYLALFNVPKERKITREAMARGFRGVFYESMPLDIVAKGVRQMMEGELWYSRESLTTFLLDPEGQTSAPEQAAASLTSREREILVRIAAGASNQEIADDLFISLHTVKSHTYNVFKKIDVPNRLQAALWAAKYL